MIRQHLLDKYPEVMLNGMRVKYDPQKMEMEAGEFAEYWDPRSGDTKSGVIDSVSHSKPWGYAIYHIDGEDIMYCHAWPVTDKEKLEKLECLKRNALHKLTKEERKALNIK